MIEIVVSIGNTDNKLTQQQWAEYVQRVGDELERYEERRHFFGGSENWRRWQNVVWLAIVDAEDVDRLTNKLIRIRKDYHQDSIYIMVGEGKLV